LSIDEGRSGRAARYEIAGEGFLVVPIPRAERKIPGFKVVVEHMAPPEKWITDPAINHIAQRRKKPAMAKAFYDAIT
jgi:hypothetical protein